MDLGDILGPEQVLSEMKASNRWEAIDELIEQLIHSAKIKAENREAITGVVVLTAAIQRWISELQAGKVAKHATRFRCRTAIEAR